MAPSATWEARSERARRASGPLPSPVRFPWSPVSPFTSSHAKFRCMDDLARALLLPCSTPSAASTSVDSTFLPNNPPLFTSLKQGPFPGERYTIEIQGWSGNSSECNRGVEGGRRKTPIRAQAVIRNTCHSWWNVEGARLRVACEQQLKVLNKTHGTSCVVDP